MVLLFTTLYNLYVNNIQYTYIMLYLTCTHINVSIEYYGIYIVLLITHSSCIAMDVC